jgi:hypothetical protein
MFSSLSGVPKCREVMASAKEEAGDLRLTRMSQIAEEEAAAGSDHLAGGCWACWMSFGPLFVRLLAVSIVRSLLGPRNPEQDLPEEKRMAGRSGDDQLYLPSLLRLTKLIRLSEILCFDGERAPSCWRDFNAQ